ncbi:MAG: hypothetical protein U5N55_10690 [Cypionkella sp.]|nr:hypothetical protein [Cypionkella sp.]
MNDHDHCDRYVGATTTAGIYAIYVLASSNNILIDGVTFGLGGAIANVHPYLGVLEPRPIVKDQAAQYRDAGGVPVGRDCKQPGVYRRVIRQQPER